MTSLLLSHQESIVLHGGVNAVKLIQIQKTAKHKDLPL
jgi:hypothetical protein